MRPMPLFPAACAAVVLAGCAQGGFDAGGPETTVTPTPALSSRAAVQPMPVVPAQAPSVELSKSDLALDCKKLRGRISLLVLQLKAPPGKGGSDAARTLQQTVTPVLGGAKHGTETADARRQRDRALAEAYNKRLVAKGCKPVDLAAELKT